MHTYENIHTHNIHTYIHIYTFIFTYTRIYLSDHSSQRTRSSSSFHWLPRFPAIFHHPIFVWNDEQALYHIVSPGRYQLILPSMIPLRMKEMREWKTSFCWIPSGRSEYLWQKLPLKFCCCGIRFLFSVKKISPPEFPVHLQEDGGWGWDCCDIQVRHCVCVWALYKTQLVQLSAWGEARCYRPCFLPAWSSIPLARILDTNVISKKTRKSCGSACLET
jgi:hypothetical protein